MFDRRSQNAISAAAISLFVFIASVACFLPPLYNYVSHSILLMIALGMAIGISVILHFIFVGVAAGRLGKNIVLWVTLSIVFFPIGSIAGLILFEWFSDESQKPPAVT